MPFIRLRKCIYKKELEFLIHKDQDPLAQRAGESKFPRGPSVSQAFELGNGNKHRSDSAKQQITLPLAIGPAAGPGCRNGTKQ